MASSSKRLRTNASDSSIFPSHLPDVHQTGAPSCVTNDCATCQTIIGNAIESGSLQSQSSYQQLIWTLHRVVPDVIFPYNSRFLFKDLSVFFGQLLAEQNCFQLISPSGFGKTSLGRLWCAYWEGDGAKFDWHDGLKQLCLPNKDKFTVLHVDLSPCLEGKTVRSCLLSAFLSKSLPIPTSFDLGEFFRSEGNANWCLFLDHCEKVLESPNGASELQSFVSALAGTPVLVFFASSRNIQALQNVPKITVDSSLGYSSQEIEDLFKAHLLLLKQIPPFNSTSDSMLIQISNFFQLASELSPPGTFFSVSLVMKSITPFHISTL